MRYKYLFFLLFNISFCFAQGEANIWYFGVNAGLDFNSGSPVALTNGQLNTIEGCATLADNTGNLLFYTDGITVWSKNHQVMSNGTGLLGHTSSTQSATIVPKPGSLNLYYVFTLDAFAGSNGFRYSIVDMSLNGGLGQVVTKNVLVYTPSNEKIAIVKHANNTDFWVVTHGWNNNNFYSYLLTSSGLAATPVISSTGVIVNGSTSNVWGYMKISPNGKKLAISNAGHDLELLDFDVATGVVSNPKVLYGIKTYGVEFSPNSELLYATHALDSPSSLLQYDVNASDVLGSMQIIFEAPNVEISALQLGPDGKIYIAHFNQPNLGVINNPDVMGSGCNLQLNAIDLAGRRCQLGLPPFVTSYFYVPYIQSDTHCEDQTTNFSINTSLPIISATWDFGDGSALVSGASPSHTYTTSGNYTVSVTVTTSLGVRSSTKEITIANTPTATQPQDILICDDNNDGKYEFDLTSRKNDILNGQDANQFLIKYYASNTDYSNNLPIAVPTKYINTTTYQQQTIIAEVYNKDNGDCKATTTFNIDVFDTPRPATSIAPLTSCDNTSFGTDTDGKVVFDLELRKTAILNGQLASQFTVSYYKNAALTIPIVSPSNYVNTNPTETIYVKVVNNDNINCFATTSFTIEVFPLPTIASVVSLKQCDDNIDGFSVFNLTEANSKISANYQNETISFYELASEAQSGINPIPNADTYAYTNQTVSNDVMYVRVVNGNGCFRTAQLNLNVSTTQIPAAFTRSFTVCDDAVQGTNTDGVSSFNFSGVTAQIQNIFPVGQQLIIAYYRNLADALAERDAITDTANYRNIGYPNSQNIYIRVDSAINNDCLGLGQHITLNVERIPIVQPKEYKECDDDQDGKYPFNTTTIQSDLLNGLTNVTVKYFDQNNNPLSSPLPNPFVTATQTIKAVVTNNTPTACNYETTIKFIVDDLPEAFPISTLLTTVCDDEVNPVNQDGKYPFDTSTFQNTILGSQTGMIVNYYDQNNNPLPSPLPNPFTTTTQNVRVEVLNPINTTCKAIYTIPFVVNPVPKINLDGNEIVCNQLIITKTLDAAILDGTPITDYTYLWKKDNVLLPTETNYTLNVNQEGIYTVEVTNGFNCSRTRTITVVASDLATISNVQVSDLSNDNSIVVTVTGNGDYVYSLNNIDFQESNTFENIPAGVYTVYVKDLNGCGVSTQQISVLGIPNYFTPNGDNYHDYWNIKGISSSSNANSKIYIFDRFGKLLKQISPMSQGWDGTFNNEPLPANDYWYSVELEDGRNLKGHFTLKR